MNCMCLSLRSFSWHTKATEEACIRAYEIVITKTRKMLDAAFSLSFSTSGIGHGLLTTVNLSLLSPVASFMIDSYIN